MLPLVLLSVFGLARGMNFVLVGAGSNCRMAMSSDGTKMVAGPDGGTLYNSKDSGATWTQRTEPGSKPWRGVAMSADGSKISTAPRGSNFWMSDNGGDNWTEISSHDAWTATAMSDDGSVIVVTSTDAEISTSADGGQNWVEETGIAMRFEAAASTANGSYLVVMASYSSSYSNGGVYTSTDSGATWVEATAPHGGTQNGPIALSADGMIQVLVHGRYVDRGPTWQYRPVHV